MTEVKNDGLSKNGKIKCKINTVWPRFYGLWLEGGFKSVKSIVHKFEIFNDVKVWGTKTSGLVILVNQIESTQNWGP